MALTQVPASMTVEGLTAAAINAALALKADDSAAVHKTGDETIAGVKTFSSQPVLPQWLTQGTAQATTSGTSKDFTGIPSWAKRITIALNGVSVSGSANLLVRLGTSGGVEATGYASQVNAFNNTPSGAADTTGVILTWGNTAAYAWNAIVTLVNVSGNVWVANGTGMTNAVGSTSLFSSSKTLSAVLDRVRITTTNGTDTFDAGSVNILYE